MPVSKTLPSRELVKLDLFRVRVRIPCRGSVRVRTPRCGSVRVRSITQSLTGTLDRPRVVAPSKTCGHVRSSRRRWR